MCRALLPRSQLLPLATPGCSLDSLAPLASSPPNRWAVSMLSPFADRAARVRAAQVGHCANAVASYSGREPFCVIFRRAPHASLDVIGGIASECRLELASVPDVLLGGVLDIDGAAYEVVSPVEPDRSGWVVLQLRAVEGGHGSAHARPVP